MNKIFHKAGRSRRLGRSSRRVRERRAGTTAGAGASEEAVDGTETHAGKDATEVASWSCSFGSSGLLSSSWHRARFRVRLRVLHHGESRAILRSSLRINVEVGILWQLRINVQVGILCAVVLVDSKEGRCCCAKSEKASGWGAAVSASGAALLDSQSGFLHISASPRVLHSVPWQ